MSSFWLKLITNFRAILDGEGYFDVRDENENWIRLEAKKGDLLVMPAGIYHRHGLSNRFSSWSQEEPSDPKKIHSNTYGLHQSNTAFYWQSYLDGYISRYWWSRYCKHESEEKLLVPTKGSQKSENVLPWYGWSSNRTADVKAAIPSTIWKGWELSHKKFIVSSL